MIQTFAGVSMPNCAPLLAGQRYIYEQNVQAAVVRMM